MESLLYRAMTSDANGRPVCEDSARGLGVRVPRDIEPSEDGVVRPRTGGLSVTPEDPKLLPAHRRPPAFGGWGKDPVFEISEQQLGEDLAYRPDEGREAFHGFVEPGRPMPLSSYREALRETAPRWRTVA